MFSDLAVGAPFEGSGCVYIFLGHIKGIVEKYSQRIAASDLLSARPLATFGYSLVGGNDMDGNEYPDLAVGAFDSNKARTHRLYLVCMWLTSSESFPLIGLSC